MPQVQLKKTLKAFEKKKTEGRVEKEEEGAVPAYLLDRKDHTEGKALSKQVKQKRQDKAAKFNVPIPKVRAQSENEVRFDLIFFVFTGIEYTPSSFMHVMGFKRY